MSTKFITSANAVFTLTIQELFNAPLTLENWESDRAWESEDREVTESHMSIDGKLNVGFIPTPINQTFSFSPNSSSLVYFDTLHATMEQLRRPFWMNGELTLDNAGSIGKKYTFVNGVIKSLTPVPSGGKVLEGRKVHIVWEQVTAAGI